MKLRIIISLLTLIALVSTALAQGDYEEGGGENSDPTTNQTITVTIPERLALHLTETTYELDLSDPGNGNFVEYAGDWPSQYWPDGEGCYMLPKHVTLNPALETMIALTSAVYHNGTPVASYPAVILDGEGVAQDGAGNWQKGSLVCFNQKVIQKFANVPWTFSADVNIDGAIGTFGIVDVIIDRYYAPVTYTNGYDGRNEGDLRHMLTQSESGLVLATGNGATNGWLDDQITEIFWFDGTETPGTHTVTVTYTLASP